MKRKYGLEVREHYNISKNENQKVLQCPIEKEKAILDALKYFHMIVALAKINPQFNWGNKIL